MPPRLLPAPLRGVSAVLLAMTLVGAWAYTTAGAEGPRVAQLARTRATLNDGLCAFSVAVHVHDAAVARTIDRRQSEIRGTLVALLRTKSRYMVSNPTAREALRVQMLREVNRVMEFDAADEVRITEFILS